MTVSYDAIVVGARCAGSPTAMLLARQGRRVLLLDRARFPSETFSTHFIWPRGMSYLQRWGLLAATTLETPTFDTMTFQIDGRSFDARTPEQVLADRFQELHGDGRAVTAAMASIRRPILDSRLLAAAIEEGVEFRESCAVSGLLFDGGRVCGVRGRDAQGTEFEARASLVIGADGVSSTVAREARAEVIAHNADCAFVFWSYFSRLPVDNPILFRRGHLGGAIVPTSDGRTLVTVVGPRAWGALFRRDIEGNFFRVLRRIDPVLCEQVADARREERYLGSTNQKAFHRRAAGPGWLLVGDAAFAVDQLAAIGITHAFRDAELAAQSLGEAEQAGLPPAAGGEIYRERQERDLRGRFETSCRHSKMELLPAEMHRFLDLLVENRALADRYMAVSGDTLRLEEYWKREATEVDAVS